ncbi:heavy metal translocating P-type ATPase [Xanthobacteraceae bacterium Astr-EGSB]|uniref:heavy metal translocating P-type ATPase n=1 Tax=Astrobacterium formosum TaxID=3069710 RepID=UPI0027B375CF|nr:heavy metal translocating P-type ATPase [Xanthobacteraceae bacterium Astr-EGSB]
MTQTLDLSALARTREDGACEMELAVDGMSCGGCIAKIEGTLNRMPGVVAARVNFTNRRLSVAWTREVVSASDIVTAIERLGYGAHPFVARVAEGEDAAEAKSLLRCLAVAGFAAMNIMLLSVSVWSGNVTDITPETRDFFHWLSALIALPAAAYAGRPFFKSAWSALRVASVNMDVPISLGVILALGMSVVETVNHAEHAYFDSAVMLLFFLLCGRYLDRAMRKKTRAVAGNLAALRADTACKLTDCGCMNEVPASTLHAGDRILVRPGDRVAADGIIEEGASDLDESLVTGETLRREARAGEPVYAGSINFSSVLTVRVTAAGEDTLLDDIERLLDKAVKSKSRIVALADRAARLYAPVVHTTAALTLAGWLIAGASLHDAVITAIAVLIITCPCALALAVPAVQVVTAGRLFRAGVLLNSGDAIERLAEVDTVVFDKTGTLTLPEPRVVDAGAIPADILAGAARLAKSSRHPLALALAREARDAQPVPGATEIQGQGVSAVLDGVEARFGSPAFCGVALPRDIPAGASAIAFRHGTREAVFLVQQSLRADAVAVAKALATRGLRLRILSGDRAEAVEPIANALGITDWRAGMRPADKVASLEALRTQGHRVLMVGDGLNDAPALAAAHVSLSPVTAAELSQAHADAVFMGAALAPVVDAVTASVRARRLMRQNLMLAVIYNAVAVPVAIAGLVTPLIAALAMSGSSMLVTLNALRLRLPARRGSGTMAAAERAEPARLRTT